MPDNVDINGPLMFINKPCSVNVCIIKHQNSFVYLQQIILSNWSDTLTKGQIALTNWDDTLTK